MLRKIKEKIQDSKSYYTKELLKSVKKGDVERVKKCLKKKANPNAQYIAVQDSDYLSYKKLIRQIEDQDLDGMTPLGLICSRRWMEKQDLIIAELLLEKGADLNVKGKNGETPLRAACRNKNIPMVNFLLQKGADPNETNTLEMNVLSYAMGNFFDDHSYGNKLLSLLLYYGADPNLKGTDSLRWAYNNVNFSGVRLLLQYGADPNVKDFYGKHLWEVDLSKGFYGLPHLEVSNFALEKQTELAYVYLHQANRLSCSPLPWDILKEIYRYAYPEMKFLYLHKTQKPKLEQRELLINKVDKKLEKISTRRNALFWLALLEAVRNSGVNDNFFAKTLLIFSKFLPEMAPKNEGQKKVFFKNIEEINKKIEKTRTPISRRVSKVTPCFCFFSHSSISVNDKENGERIENLKKKRVQSLRQRGP